MTEERKAIVAYLRMRAEKSKQADGNAECLLLFDALKAVEEMHPDTLPTKLEYACLDNEAEIRRIVHCLHNKDIKLAKKDLLIAVLRLSGGRYNPNIALKIIDEVIGG